MKLKTLHPVIYTLQLKETVQFYTEELGFTCENFSAELGWASVMQDDVAFMISQPNAHLPFNKPVFTGSFYITTDDVDAIWQQLRDKAKISYPIENFEYGMREFGIYDNNGYLIQFAQELPGP